jgi:hypothetical protein
MPYPFHVRFNIDIPIEEARRRFTHRITNRVRKLAIPSDYLDSVLFESESTLGEPHPTFIDAHHFDPYPIFIQRWIEIVNGDFLRCLHALEGLAKGLRAMNVSPNPEEELNTAISDTLAESEVDVGVCWQDGCFTKKGAELLDQKLVNESLRWLANPKYHNVLVPFQKGLSHLLEGSKELQRYGDAVTDMYEALEAMAKIVTGKTKDLSALREEFISKLKLSDSHKRMLKEYIDYGCDFRHALEERQTRTWPLEHEAENFVYLTGLFLRLAIQSTQLL